MNNKLITLALNIFFLKKIKIRFLKELFYYFEKFKDIFNFFTCPEKCKLQACKNVIFKIKKSIEN